MNTRFKVFASYNILQYLCDSIQVFIFVTVSKCRKSPKLTNIAINSFTNGRRLPRTHMLVWKSLNFYEHILIHAAQLATPWKFAKQPSLDHDNIVYSLH
jgi:hypothetical protein